MLQQVLPRETVNRIWNEARSVNAAIVILISVVFLMVETDQLAILYELGGTQV